MIQPDKRIHAYRDDLADIALEGQVDALKFVLPDTYHISSPSSFVKKSPHDDAQIVTQALCGEEVQIFDKKGDWAWGQLMRDRYVGYISLADMSQDVCKPTCKVIVKHTHVYPSPEIKTHPRFIYHMGAHLCGSVHDEKFMKVASGYVIRCHLAPIDMIETDFVSVAESFSGTPYLWGGKTSFGLDCSGLVQIALQAVGEEAPRDSDMQANQLGVPLAQNEWNNLRRGDLVFWKGHVGVMTDEKNLLHANGHHMMVVSEPLQEARKRIAAEYGNITQINRF